VQGVPKQITAGETLVFAVDVPSESGATYAFCLATLAALALVYVDGFWRVEIPSEQTATLKPGVTKWQLWQTAPGHRLIDSGTIRIAPSLLLGHDTRSHEQQVLVALREALLDLAAGKEAEINIHNRVIKFRDPQKVQEMIDQYQMLVNMQQGVGPITCMPVVIR
jgi:hypothetical protein